MKHWLVLVCYCIALLWSLFSMNLGHAKSLQLAIEISIISPKFYVNTNWTGNSISTGDILLNGKKLYAGSPLVIRSKEYNATDDRGYAISTGYGFASIGDKPVDVIFHGVFDDSMLNVGNNELIFNSTAEGLYLGETCVPKNGEMVCEDAKKSLCISGQSMKVSIKVGEVADLVFFSDGCIKGMDSFSQVFHLNPAAIDPALVAEVEENDKQIREMQAGLPGLLKTYFEKKKEIERISDCVNSQIKRPLDEMDENACGLNSVQELLNSGKKAIDTLRREIAEERERIKENIELSNASLLEEIKKRGIDKDDLKKPVVPLDLSFIDALSLSEIPNAPILDISNNPYISFANEINSRLENAIQKQNRGEFLLIVSEWKEHLELYLDIITNRMFYVNGEIEAFERARSLTQGVIDKYLTKDLFFRDLPVPSDVQDFINIELSRYDEDRADRLRSAINGWKGSEPEKARKITELLRALDVVLSAYREAYAEYLSNKAHKDEDAIKAKRQIDTIVDGITSIALGFAPGNDAIDLYEIVSGNDFVTGENLTHWQRVGAGAGLIIGSRRVWQKMSEGASEVSKVLRESEKIADSAGKYGFKTAKEIKAFGKVLEAIETLPGKLKVQRLRKGADPNKVAIVGRSMGNADAGLVGVKDAAAHLKTKGVNPTIYEPSPEAWNSFMDRVRKYRKDVGNNAAMLPDDIAKTTDLYKENTAWAIKLRDEGYTVLDLDNPNNLPDASVFYEMEKSILF